MEKMNSFEGKPKIKCDVEQLKDLLNIAFEGGVDAWYVRGVG